MKKEKEIMNRAEAVGLLPFKIALAVIIVAYAIFIVVKTLG